MITTTEPDMTEAVRIKSNENLERIRRHPFIVKACAQSLSRQQAERWILCAGRESRSFPRILENMIARTEHARIKDALRRNLDDEHGNGNPADAHFMHYMHLLDELRLPRERFANYREGAGIQLALRIAERVSQGSEAVAVGYMLVNEGMTSIIYSSLHTALLAYYPEIKTPFFRLHVEIDDRHLEELYSIVDELDASSFEDVLYGIEIGERGMAALLDEAYGLLDQ